MNGRGRRSSNSGSDERQRIRVLHVINQLSARAGAETSLREIIGGSRDAHLEHGVVTLRPVDRPEVAAEHAHLFAPTERAGLIQLVVHTVRAIDEYGPTMIHTSLFEADLIGRLAGLITRTPVITSLVNTPYGSTAVRAEVVPAWKIAAVRQVDRLLARNATSGFHAISDATAEHAVRFLGVDRRTIRVVRRGRSSAALGTRTAERRRAVRESMGWGGDPVVLCVARQEPQKGHLHLLDAMPSLLQSHPRARLVLAGRPGRATEAIRQRSAALGLADVIEELGERADIPDLLAASDAFAFPSLYEGLGGAVVEAAGAALPVAAFDLPAIREVLGEAHPWLVPVGDARGLARALAEILDGGDEVEATALAQRDRFLGFYELANCVTQMSDMYRDAARELGRADSHRLVRPRRLNLDG